MFPEQKSGRQLADAVRRAFLDVVYPGDDELLADDCCDIHEIAGLQSQEWNCHWASVPDSAIEQHSQSLSFMSPEAFRFYLPAFITYALEKPDSDKPVLPFLVYELMNTAEGTTPNGKWHTLCERRIGLLSSEQKKVVFDFLEYVRDVLRDPMCIREAERTVERLRPYIQREKDNEEEK